MAINAQNVIESPFKICGGSIVLSAYSWEGLTPVENHEAYLIHIYSPAYHRHLKEYNDEQIKMVEYEEEIDTIRRTAKRISKQKQNRIYYLEGQINRIRYRTLNDHCHWINMELRVNKNISLGNNYNNKTNTFDTPDIIKQTTRDNIGYIISLEFINRHVRYVNHIKAQISKRLLNPNVLYCDCRHCNKYFGSDYIG